MAGYDYDLFVIGAGSGGVRAARVAAGHGARVAIAEERHLGGTCVNAGCIPKKLLVYASELGAAIADARAYGWLAQPASLDWSALRARKDAEVERLNRVYERLLTEAGVEIVPGRAVLTGPHEVRVAGRTVRAERILVATGGWPTVPEVPGRELAITSNEAFHLERLPRRVLIVGGGYIAVEFAGIFNGLGVRTTLAYRGELFLRGFDRGAREHLARELTRAGIALRFGVNVTRIERANGGLTAELDDGTRIGADVVMYATGRAPNVAGLGLEALGVELTWNGAIVVDDDYRSSVPSIYALGDVTHRMNLTPVAIAEAMAFADRVYGGRERRVDYDFIPTAVFSQPSLAAVGLPEETAREHYGDIEVFETTFTPLKHTLTGRGERAYMKLVVAAGTGRVVGAHVVAPEAAEIVQSVAIAIRAGATKEIFDSTIGIHPTLAEELVTLRTPRGA